MMIQSGLYRNIQQWLIPRIKYQRTLLNTYVEDRINALLTKDPNKLKVYTGYKQYELEINGIIYLISEDTILEYEGNLLTGEELYEKLSSC